MTTMPFNVNMINYDQTVNSDAMTQLFSSPSPSQSSTTLHHQHQQQQSMQHDQHSSGPNFANTIA